MAADIVNALPTGGWVAIVGGLVGSAVAAYQASRAAHGVRKAETKADSAEAASSVIREEVLGPGSEPSIRDMLKLLLGTIESHRDEVKHSFDGIHGDFSNLSDRMKGLENTVFKQMEERIDRLETAAKDYTLVVTTLSSLSEQVQHQAVQILRSSSNIHRLAQAVQVKLLTQEEAMDEAVKAGRISLQEGKKT